MSYKDSERYQKAKAAMLEAAQHDIQLVERAPQAKATVEIVQPDEAGKSSIPPRKMPYSVIYHENLAYYVQQLSAPHEPSEALSLASYCQHIRRWEIPRNTYSEGLSGYKQWRFQLNKFHTACAFDILVSAGYSQTTDGQIFTTIENLLQKKTLKGGNDRGEEEMQLFEDAICLTFLALEFSNFAQKHDEEKMINIVRKTWGKMGAKGRTYAQDHLAAGLDEEGKTILTKALQDTA